MVSTLRFYLTALFWGINLSCGWAQDQLRTLTAATLYISVEHWGDVWLNGVHIVDQLPFTPAGQDCHVFVCKHLCYFQKDNLLALEVTDTRHPESEPPNPVGIAYVLKLSFSDGTQEILSSNDIDQHESFYEPDIRTSEPPGWQFPGFKENNHWAVARCLGARLSQAADFESVGLGTVKFLSASSHGNRAFKPGERHFFRRFFSLEFSPQPPCGGVQTTVVVSRQVKKIQVISDGTNLLSVENTKLNKKEDHTSSLGLVQDANDDDDESFVPRATVEPLMIRAANPSNCFSAISTPTPSSEKIGPVTPLISMKGSDFGNFYVSFDDGPGLYELYIVDSIGNVVRALMSQRVIDNGAVWIGWDGKDDRGDEAPSGVYSVILSKDDEVLRRIKVTK